MSGVPPQHRRATSPPALLRAASEPELAAGAHSLEPVSALRRAIRVRAVDWDSSGAQLAAAIAVSVLGGLTVAAVDDPVVVAGLFAGAALIAIGMLAPALFLSLLLLLRPLLDAPLGATVGDLPSANAAGAVGLVAVGVAAIIVARKPRLVDPRVTLALAGILLVSALAGSQAFLEFGGRIGLEPIAELARLAALLAIYLLAGHVFGTERGVRTLFLIVALSAAIPITVGLVELTGGVEPVPGFDIGRISSTFVGPVPFSAFLGVTALILIYLPRDLLHPALRLLLLTGGLVALVATYSRAGWLIFLIGLVLLEWRRRKRTLVAAAAIVAVLVVAIPEVQQRVLPTSPSASGRDAGESFEWRLANWGGLLERYEERPFTGWGLRSTGYVNPRAPVGAPPEGGGYDAHNTVVRALVEGGPLLLLAYLALVGTVVVSLRRIVRDEAWPLQPFARVLVVIWLTLTLVALGSDDPFEVTAMMYAVLALTGALHAAHSTWLTERGTRRAVRAGPSPILPEAGKGPRPQHG